MATIQFGVGTVNILDNRGIDVVAGDLSASASEMTAGANRSVIIDGVTAIWSAQTVSVTALLTTALGATGVGLLYYVYLSAGDTTTATVALATAADPLNTATNIPSAICPLFKFNFGNGANAVSAIVPFSGGSATRTLQRVQNVSINAGWESAMMRGGTQQYASDTKFFDATLEGSFQFSEQTGTHNLFFGGIYATAGGNSGTWTLSGNSRPNSISLVFQNVTNGITSTYRVMKCYLTQQTNDFTRTEYMQPTWNFIAQENIQGTVFEIVG